MNLNQKIKECLAICPQTKEFIIGKNAFDKIPEVLAERYEGNKNVLIIGDSITMQIAGDRISDICKKAGFNVDAYIFVKTDKEDWDYIHEIQAAIEKNSSIPVIVGAGYLNDIVKVAAFEAKTKYVCIPTVASVDGYCSSGAAIKTNGSKNTYNCWAPYVVVAEPEVLAGAPKFLTAAGYGDLAAKVPAGAEWMIADLFGTEPIHEAAWNCFFDILPELLGNPKGVAEGDGEAVQNIFAGLALSGISMQVCNDTRPASCAEHLFSHVLDMTHHTFNGRPQLHGDQVSIGTLTMCAVFDEILKYDFTKIDVDKCVAAWPSLEEVQKDAIDTYADFPIKNLGYEMMTRKYESADKVRKELENLKVVWPEFKKKLEAQLWSFDKMKEHFDLCGAPTDPSRIGITRAYLKHILPKAAQMRWRINAFDLLKRCGIYEEVVEKIFGKGGAWDLAEEKLK
ncbi:MAG: iron-containing alcohol dehydrogenase [Bacteroidales bacterium]|nr:iron-containing alcohol dehydrogenase [Bacteroidales bacterium]